MKRILLQLAATLIFAATLTAQQISVESFRILPNDLDARVAHPQHDQNGDVAALIKIVTTETGFYWEGGMLGIVHSERKPGEYWVYVPRGAQRITIKHDDLGVLRNYAYPEPIEAATVYEMRLVTGRVETTVIPAEIESQWLLISVEPATAMIYLNDKFEATGTLSKKLMPGSYTYRAEAPLYHTEAGRFTITAAKKEELSLRLNPNYGFVEVKSTPETGARVMIDGREAGFVTNGTSDKLQSGEHTVTVVKEQFQPTSRKITVSDGQTTTLTLDMAPNFATVEVKLPSDATLYINNEQKGRGNWSGRLNAGVYTFEARKDKHRPAKQDMQLQAGDSKTINLDPRPITGSLDVVSAPPRAKIKLNGTDHGTTPNTIPNLLIGEYTLTLELAGHATVTKNITVGEGGSTLVNETLPAGRQITITSQPAGAELFINNLKLGTTPYTGELGFGSHNVKLVNNTKTIQETIIVAQTGTNSFTFDVNEFTDPFEGQMVFVKGGTFTMGCTSEQSDCDDDEKPAHQVTVSDFYIGKYEVTQKQWREIMGNNPSHFSGCDNCPVENVSWNDIQEFIKKLNQKTGKKYRLPTEAEWEYAARGGVETHGRASDNNTPRASKKYAGSNNIEEVAWYSSNSGSKTNPVGRKKPNELGIFDMSGNVWEWCSDWYGSNYYKNSPQTNPQGPSSGAIRVLRGGSWSRIAQYCRVSNRSIFTSDFRIGSRGFRLALAP